MPTTEITSADHGGMKSFAHVLGGIVLGLGLASAVGLDPSFLFALYTIGLGLTLLCIGFLMTDDATAGRAPGIHDDTVEPDR